MAGKLRESVAFDSPSGSADGFGGTSVEWTEAHTSRAKFIYQKGGEAVQAAREANRQAFKIMIRQCADARAITAEYRMRDVRRSVAYKITDVDAITDQQYVWISVEGPVVT